jgi:predicted phage baseplate assembly protein
MPLSTPTLDDRRFQDIVDQAKLLIPRYCPEWTDHNVSDPGVALIELFAWMTDLLLYRVNQVPDKLYVKFLDMIGVKLAEARAAAAPVTVYLSAPQPVEITIPQETEVATIRTETEPAIVFTTEADLTIRPPNVIGAYTRTAAAAEAEAPWIMHDLRRLGLPGQRLVMFTPPPAQPAPNDAFYLAFDKDHSHHVLALRIECELAGGAGIDPTDPPTLWEVYQGAVAGWVACTVEYDGTGGFNRSGEIILHTDAMTQRDSQGVNAYWLRCRLTEAQGGSVRYHVSPELERITVEARGGTTLARHATTVHDEVLGYSDGTPGQTFRLLHTPILARDPQRDHLVVEQPGGAPEAWREVDDFGDSTETDRHFTLDSRNGTLSLGPALLQPNGQVYRFGAVPPKGNVLRFRRYQHGGGVAGNVPKGALSVPKSSIPYLARVTNWRAAIGGLDAQSLDDAKLRAPQVLRTRTRAVTADDYEYLAQQVEGVARARCVGAGAQGGASGTRPAGDPAQPGDPGGQRPGRVSVLIVPQVDDASGPIPAEQLARSAELRARVLAHLNERRPLGITVDVRQPQYIWVAVQATLRTPDGSDASLNDLVQRSAARELYRYLNPLVGGPRGAGWPFGRDLSVSELYALLQRVRNVEFVEEVRLSIAEPGGPPIEGAATARLVVPQHALVCSAQHLVTVASRVDQ